MTPEVRNQGGTLDCTLGGGVKMALFGAYFSLFLGLFGPPGGVKWAFYDP